jgi:hypothetical protein
MTCEQIAKMDDHIQEFCLSSIPGEILVIRWKNNKQESSDRSRFELGEVTRSVPLERPNAQGNQRLLQIVSVPIRQELRYLDLLSRERGVLKTSLNYTGQLSSNTAVESQKANEKSTKVEWYIFDTNKGLLNKSDAIPPVSGPVIVAVDVRENHCKDVLEAASLSWKVHNESINRLSQDSTFLGLIRWVPTTTVGLFDYIDAFTKLTELKRCPDAIVTSVDLGRACLRQVKRDGSELGGQGGENPWDGSAALAAYSFPAAELAFRIILRDCLKNKCTSLKEQAEYTGYGLPIVFSAAGNHLTTLPKRQRLAYPALLPEFVATTFCQRDVDSDVVPTEYVEMPLAHDIKPILAVESSKASSSGAKTEGTSYAAPWCAGWWIANLYADKDHVNWEPEALFAPLARNAWIQKITRPSRMVAEIDKERRSTPVCVLGDDLTAARRSSGDCESRTDMLANRLRTINRQLPFAEIALTGSLVTLIVASDRYTYEIGNKTNILLDPGDIDVVFFAEVSLNALQEEQIRTKVTWALADILLRSESPRRIEVHHIDARVAPISLFQAVIPALSMLLTSEGLLDVWGGVRDINKSTVSVIMPVSETKLLRNPQAYIDRYARLPSVLAAISIVLRLRVLQMSSGLEPEVELQSNLASLIQELIHLEGEYVNRSAVIVRLRKINELIDKAGSSITDKLLGKGNLSATWSEFRKIEHKPSPIIN